MTQSFDDFVAEFHKNKEATLAQEATLAEGIWPYNPANCLFLHAGLAVDVGVRPAVIFNLILEEMLEKGHPCEISMAELCQKLDGILSRWIIAKSLKTLRNEEWLMDLTPNRKTRSHVYALGSKTGVPIPPSISEPNPGFIYIIQADDAFKIGYAKRPKRRLIAIQNASPHQAKLIHKIATGDMEASEQTLHERFTDRHIRGEWFRLTPEDVAWIKSIGQM